MGLANVATTFAAFQVCFVVSRGTELTFQVKKLSHVTLDTWRPVVMSSTTHMPWFLSALPILGFPKYTCIFQV